MRGILAGEAPDDAAVTVKGWVRTRRDSKAGISFLHLSDGSSLPRNAITAILHGDRRITAEMAMRLGKAFGIGERYWMNLESYYDAKIAREKMAEKIAAIQPLVAS